MVYAVSIVRNRPKKRPKMTGERRRLFIEHKALCAYCRRRTVWPSILPGKSTQLDATVDHVLPVSKGGKMKGENTTLACALCNGLKRDMTPHEWAEFMMMNPEWWLNPRFRRGVYRRPLPIDDTKFILAHGTKAYKKARAAVRPLRPDEPVPIEFEDPGQQAAFEAYAKKYRHVLRIPDEGGAQSP